MSTDTVSPLRQRMIEDMNARKLCAGTQTGHIRSCKRFAAFLKRSPDTATLEDIRRFQLHLAETGVSICTRNRIMTGLRFLFRVTLRRLDLAAEIYHLREPQKIPLVMSPDETKRLLAVASSLKARILLSLGYGCGLRAGEVVRLKVKHIDSAQKIIRIEQSKGRKDRNVIHRQVGRLLALEDAIDVSRSAPVLVDEIGSIGDQTAGSDVGTFRVDRRQFVSGREHYDEIAMKRRQRACGHDQAATVSARKGSDGALNLGRIAHVDRAYLHPERRRRG